MQFSRLPNFTLDIETNICFPSPRKEKLLKLKAGQITKFTYLNRISLNKLQTTLPNHSIYTRLHFRKLVLDETYDLLDTYTGFWV